MTLSAFDEEYLKTTVERLEREVAELKEKTLTEHDLHRQLAEAIKNENTKKERVTALPL